MTGPERMIIIATVTIETVIAITQNRNADWIMMIYQQVIPTPTHDHDLEVENIADTTIIIDFKCSFSSYISINIYLILVILAIVLHMFAAIYCQYLHSIYNCILAQCSICVTGSTFIEHFHQL